MPDGSQVDLTRTCQEEREPSTTLEQKKDGEKADLYRFTKGATWSRLYGWLAYVPPWCRYDPKQPFKFSMGLNFLFGISSLGPINSARILLTHVLLYFSLCSMFHRRESVLQPSHPQPPRPRLRRDRVSVLLHPHAGSGRLCRRIAISLSIGRPP